MNALGESISSWPSVSAVNRVRSSEGPPPPVPPAACTPPSLRCVCERKFLEALLADVESLNIDARTPFCGARERQGARERRWLSG